MRHLQALILVGLLAMLTSFALAGDRIAGIYSSLRYIEEGGDLIGMEVIVVPSHRTAGLSYSAFVQISEGGAPDVVVVDFMEKNGKMEFVFPPGSPYAGQKLTGTLVKGEMVLKWPNGAEEHLKRGKSYWQ